MTHKNSTLDTFEWTDIEAQASYDALQLQIQATRLQYATRIARLDDVDAMNDLADTCQREVSPLLKRQAELFTKGVNFSMKARV